MLGDSRLLNNLLKTEKEAQKSFNQWTKDAASASSALSAWSVADSGDTQDLMDVSIRITQLLAACSDSQRTYLASISAYRGSLKEVLEREATLRTVVRDREILVGRLIKLGNKKPSDSAVETHQAKLEDSQRELAACESYLRDEEAALGGVKRKIFREALSMRMRRMGELGKTMEDSAREAMQLLSQLGQGYDEQGYPKTLEEYGSQAGDSITPSLSASQALSRSSSFSSVSDYQSPIGVAIPAPHQVSDAVFYPSVSAAPRQQSERPSSRASLPVLSRAHERDRTTSSASSRPAFPILPSVPVAQRGAIRSIPEMEIPKAPSRVSTRRPVDDSSDEEDEEAYASQARGGRPASRAQAQEPSSPKRFLRRRANSDTSTITDRVGREGTRKTGFFGGLASLFKRAPRDRSPPSGSTRWDTRTDRNVFTSARGAGGGGRRGEDDSSDEEVPKKRLVRVVNDPAQRAKAMSDVGAASASIKSGKSKKTIKASSDLGRLSSQTRPSTSMSVASHPAVPEPRRKKKRTESLNAPAVGASLAVPTTVARGAPGMSRSNTVTSNFTVTSSFSAATGQTDTTKPKRKKRLSTTSQGPVLLAPLTAADLAASLPSARALSYHDIGSLRGEGGVLLGADETTHASGRAPSHLRETEKRVAKENMRNGVDGWISKPSSPVLGHHEEPKDGARRASIMALVQPEPTTASPGAVEETSRRYGAGPRWVKPITTLPPSPPPSSTATPRSSDHLQPPSGVTLAKRKSVRMADGDNLSSNEPPRSPAGSVRSSDGLGSSNGGAPRHGILVNHHPSPSQTMLTNGGSEHTSWNMRSSISATFGSSAPGVDVEDSSDEDEGEYALARKAFAKGTKKFATAGLLEGSSRDKGKGRAVDQY